MEIAQRRKDDGYNSYNLRAAHSTPKFAVPPRGSLLKLGRVRLTRC